MHAHGVHQSLHQLLPQQLNTPTTTKPSQKSVDFSVFDQSKDSQSSTTENVDSDDSNALAGSNTSKTTLSTTSNDSSLEPDLTVEPMVYGASGRIKYLQTGAGSRFNESA